MGRAIVAALSGLATLAYSSCTTETCACTPAIVPAMVAGRVVDGSGMPASAAQVRAYSPPAAGCHSLDADFGFVTTEHDGSFRMGLPSGQLQDSVCILVFARPPRDAEGLRNSDTTLLAMDFRDELTLDSVRVELVLRTK